MKQLKHKKIGFIGCGNMGEALLKQLLCANAVSKTQIYVYDVKASRKKQIRQAYRVHASNAIGEVVQKSDVIVLAVKPHQLAEVAKHFSDSTKNKVLVSILAGVTTQRLKKTFGPSIQIVRVMPNLGAFVGQSMTVIAKSKTASRRLLQLAQALFNVCGLTLVLPESKMDLVTAVSGSGPAYYFLLSEVMVHAAQRLGLSKKEALVLVSQTALGASLMMLQGAATPDILRQRVTSKGGTTAAALKILNSKAWKRAIVQAVQNAQKRSKQLSRTN